MKTVDESVRVTPYELSQPILEVDQAYVRTMYKDFPRNGVLADIPDPVIFGRCVGWMLESRHAYDIIYNQVCDYDEFREKCDRIAEGLDVDVSAVQFNLAAFVQGLATSLVSYHGADELPDSSRISSTLVEVSRIISTYDMNCDYMVTFISGCVLSTLCEDDTLDYFVDCYGDMPAGDEVDGVNRAFWYEQGVYFYRNARYGSVDYDTLMGSSRLLWDESINQCATFEVDDDTIFVAQFEDFRDCDESDDGARFPYTEILIGLCGLGAVVGLWGLCRRCSRAKKELNKE